MDTLKVVPEAGAGDLEELCTVLDTGITGFTCPVVVFEVINDEIPVVVNGGFDVVTEIALVDVTL